MVDKKKKMELNDDSMRVVIVNKDKCKPKKCSLECKRECPVNRAGKLCIAVTN